jgi:cytochrome P450
MLGITAPEELTRLKAWYTQMQSAFTALPVPLPGSTYSRGLKALEAVLAFYRDIVRAHRERPSGDGLSRILAFKTPSGESISDDAAARELHHLLIAGRVVYAHLVTALREVAKNPEVRDRLRAEIRAAAPAGSLSVETLHEMRYLTEVLLEVKRTSPVVPGMFGRAKADIAFGEYTIPRGWMIMFGLRESLVDGGAFPHPERFEPERFGDPRNEHRGHEHALVPHGPGKPETSHHCAGTDYASQLVRVFLVTLVRGYDVDLPEQDLGYDWARLTPDPKDGLRARVTKRG